MLPQRNIEADTRLEAFRIPDRISPKAAEEASVSIAVVAGADLGFDFEPKEVLLKGMQVRAERHYTPTGPATVELRQWDLLEVLEEDLSGMTRVANLSLAPPATTRGWVHSWAVPKQRHVRISAVRGGLAGAWNKANPHAQLQPGAVVTELNAYSDYASILHEVRRLRKKGGLLQMKVCEQHGEHTVVQRVPEDEEQCSICMEAYTDGEQLRVLPCEHRFHTHCVDRWLQTCYHCPLCRRSPASFTADRLQPVAAIPMQTFFA